MTGAAAVDLVADLVVIGGGLVGLAIAAAAADRKLSVAVLTTQRPGTASRAAAGLLVPHYSGEGAGDSVQRFMSAGRDLYPSYVQWAEERSGVRVAFDASGAIEVARSPAECATLQRTAPDGAEPLTPVAVASLEPGLAPTAGGLLYPRDGSVDNVGLTDALATIVARHQRARTIQEPAVRLVITSGRAATVIAAAGTRVQGHRIVLAAGAWSNLIDGLPRPVPVRPVRGQLCTVRGAPLRHVVLAPDLYMVTRGGDRTVVGSTMEDVGYDAGTTAEAIEGLRHAAAAACPAFSTQPVVAAWSGLRPATPDLRPILGTEPDCPELIYACGHSRNGILLAPITAAVTCAIALGEPLAWDISPFTVQRFSADLPRD
ncbi:MAG: NAD(P)/FAD-dependent oxidoreductase [Gemmatimonadaceae bacterium]